MSGANVDAVVEGIDRVYGIGEQVEAATEVLVSTLFMPQLEDQIVADIDRLHNLLAELLVAGSKFVQKAASTGIDKELDTASKIFMSRLGMLGDALDSLACAMAPDSAPLADSSRDQSTNQSIIVVAPPLLSVLDELQADIACVLADNAQSADRVEASIKDLIVTCNSECEVMASDSMAIAWYKGLGNALLTRAAALRGLAGDAVADAIAEIKANAHDLVRWSVSVYVRGEIIQSTTASHALVRFLRAQPEEAVPSSLHATMDTLAAAGVALLKLIKNIRAVAPPSAPPLQLPSADLDTLSDRIESSVEATSQVVAGALAARASLTIVAPDAVAELDSLLEIVANSLRASRAALAEWSVVCDYSMDEPSVLSSTRTDGASSPVEATSSLLAVVHGLQSIEAAVNEGVFELDLSGLEPGSTPSGDLLVDVGNGVLQLLCDLVASLVAYVRVASTAPAKLGLCLSGIALLMEDVEPEIRYLLSLAVLIEPELSLARDILVHLPHKAVELALDMEAIFRITTETSVLDSAQADALGAAVGAACRIDGIVRSLSAILSAVADTNENNALPSSERPSALGAALGALGAELETDAARAVIRDLEPEALGDLALASRSAGGAAAVAVPPVLPDSAVAGTDRLLHALASMLSALCRNVEPREFLLHRIETVRCLRNVLGCLVVERTRAEVRARVPSTAGKRILDLVAHICTACSTLHLEASTSLAHGLGFFLSSPTAKSALADMAEALAALASFLASVLFFDDVADSLPNSVEPLLKTLSFLAEPSPVDRAVAVVVSLEAAVNPDSPLHAAHDSLFATFESEAGLVVSACPSDAPLFKLLQARLHAAQAAQAQAQRLAAVHAARSFVTFATHPKTRLYLEHFTGALARARQISTSARLAPPSPLLQPTAGSNDLETVNDVEELLRLLILATASRVASAVSGYVYQLQARLLDLNSRARVTSVTQDAGVRIERCLTLAQDYVYDVEADAVDATETLVKAHNAALDTLHKVRNELLAPLVPPSSALDFSLSPLKRNESESESLMSENPPSSRGGRAQQSNLASLVSFASRRASLSSTPKEKISDSESSPSSSSPPPSSAGISASSADSVPAALDSSSDSDSSSLDTADLEAAQEAADAAAAIGSTTPAASRDVTPAEAASPPASASGSALGSASSSASSSSSASGSVVLRESQSLGEHPPVAPAPAPLAEETAVAAANHTGDGLAPELQVLIDAIGQDMVFVAEALANPQLGETHAVSSLASSVKNFIAMAEAVCGENNAVFAAAEDLGVSMSHLVACVVTVAEVEVDESSSHEALDRALGAAVEALSGVGHATKTLTATLVALFGATGGDANGHLALEETYCDDDFLSYSDVPTHMVRHESWTSLCESGSSDPPLQVAGVRVQMAVDAMFATDSVDGLVSRGIDVLKELKAVADLATDAAQINEEFVEDVREVVQLLAKAVGTIRSDPTAATPEFMHELAQLLEDDVYVLGSELEQGLYGVDSDNTQSDDAGESSGAGAPTAVSPVAERRQAVLRTDEGNWHVFARSLQSLYGHAVATAHAKSGQRELARVLVKRMAEVAGAMEMVAGQCETRGRDTTATTLHELVATLTQSGVRAAAAAQCDDASGESLGSSHVVEAENVFISVAAAIGEVMVRVMKRMQAAGSGADLDAPDANPDETWVEQWSPLYEDVMYESSRGVVLWREPVCGSIERLPDDAPRLRSSLVPPEEVLHEVGGQPMLAYAIVAAKAVLHCAALLEAGGVALNVVIPKTLKTSCKTARMLLKAARKAVVEHTKDFGLGGVMRALELGLDSVKSFWATVKRVLRDGEVSDAKASAASSQAFHDGVKALSSMVAAVNELQAERGGGKSKAGSAAPSRSRGLRGTVASSQPRHRTAPRSLHVASGATRRLWVGDVATVVDALAPSFHKLVEGKSSARHEAVCELHDGPVGRLVQTAQRLVAEANDNETSTAHVSLAPSLVHELSAVAGAMASTGRKVVVMDKTARKEKRKKFDMLAAAYAKGVKKLMADVALVVAVRNIADAGMALAAAAAESELSEPLAAAVKNAQHLAAGEDAKLKELKVAVRNVARAVQAEMSDDALLPAIKRVGWILDITKSMYRKVKAVLRV
ncbi:uncharacterized protein AMSG_00527 [Thecamonas trahens ATCC 50062]|uniref:Uncharacterized protein n=1 Tax=Thecamonas trahens ATCC 50062 TaxID=461836 RepID=A0A0L0D937_THETB|nr:hypothetical protein AMSG_00527 [Thecamonas trahens ATCC 50062]KNC48750.1 hypothetical protein AMSG_00527 [Thecamonas trahens ATCC 50062]|eukprot:XP_013762801.1 hypothetical protein AMSG_00527 [Thecamonas trahens ATCC 50062]